MSTPTARILIIEDDPSLGTNLRRILEEEGHDVLLETRGDTALVQAGRGRVDLILTDLRLPGKGGVELVSELHLLRPRLPIIVMTAHGTAEVAIEAIKAGAYDYLMKPFEIDELLALLEKALNAARLRSGPVTMGASTGNQNSLIGRSRVMTELYKEVGRVASRPVNVLICGETGTGKELIARALFQHSDRANAPFIAINCAAIPETLLESELFGHERGAFTGADQRRIGRFEQAQAGTIFLDEIGELGMGTQAKLLRVLQEQQLERIGGRELIPINARVLAATNRDLEEAVRRGEFRQDLFYRLGALILKLPPLRERREDIPELVSHFLRRYGEDLGIAAPSIQLEALTHLQKMPWPGNVRELQNAVRKLLLLGRGYTISLDHVQHLSSPPGENQRLLDYSLRGLVAEFLAQAERGENSAAHARLLKAAEKELFQQAILLAQGNQAKAARWLGISRLTMREKLLQFGFHPGGKAGGGSEEAPG